MQKQHRPTGVTIVAILTIIGGLVLLFSGVALIALGALIPSLVNNNTTNSPFSHASAQLLGIIAAAIGSVLLAVGIGYLVMFYGLLKGKGWAWTITIVLLIIGIAIHIASTAFGSIFTASTTSLHNNNGNSGIVGAIIGVVLTQMGNNFDYPHRLHFLASFLYLS